jgi:hypothetical protein
MNEFPILRVDRSRSQSVEPQGSKPKFWFRDDNRRLLFKADDRGTGEDWAEVVTCHLCALVGLPHVEYELAAEYEGPRYIRPGVVCENMTRKPVVLVLGNELLLADDPKYPHTGRFKVRQHTAEAVADIMRQLDPPPEVWMQSAPAGVQGALEIFSGFIMLDAWAANTDRHHENWGALWDGQSMRLAPTFDHGAALARNLLDNERRERLMSKDRNRTVAAFAERGRSAFFASAADVRPLELRAAFQAFARRAPSAANVWLDRLHAVNREQIETILDRVPTGRMSEICKQFTTELLLTNQRRLLEGRGK